METPKGQERRISILEDRHDQLVTQVNNIEIAQAATDEKARQLSLKPQPGESELCKLHRETLIEIRDSLRQFKAEVLADFAEIRREVKAINDKQNIWNGGLAVLTFIMPFIIMHFIKK